MPTPRELLIQGRDLLAKRGVLVAERDKFIRERDRLDGRLSDIDKAREIILRVGREIQTSLEFKISTLVTSALSAVFPDPYEFRLVFSQRRNMTEADLQLIKDGEIFDPMDSVGYGVVDIASFALRIAYWSLKKNRPTFILDEPFRNLSADLQPRASSLLKELSTKLNLQFIIVSHNEGIIEEADRLFRVQDSVVKEVQ